MRWSKLKSLVEARFAPSVAKRVRINSTRYGNCTCGRAWITIDGEEVANFCTRAYWNEHLGRHGAASKSKPFIYGQAELSRQDAYASCWEFIHSLTLEAALADDDPLVQSLAVLDARLGSKKLAQLDATRLHPLAQELLRFRQGVETGSACDA